MALDKICKFLDFCKLAAAIRSQTNIDLKTCSMRALSPHALINTFVKTDYVRERERESMS